MECSVHTARLAIKFRAARLHNLGIQKQTQPASCLMRLDEAREKARTGEPGGLREGKRFQASSIALNQIATEYRFRAS